MAEKKSGRVYVPTYVRTYVCMSMASRWLHSCQSQILLLSNVKNPVYGLMAAQRTYLFEICRVRCDYRSSQGWAFRVRIYEYGP